MRLFEKLICSLFGIDLNSETDRQEWALAIMGFSFLDDFDECDKSKNIDSAVNTPAVRDRSEGTENR